VPAPTPRRLFFTFLVVSLVVFLRPPTTNFVFDEQEALLANPYLLGDVPVHRLPRAQSIGSYRPLPNLLWRPLAFTLGFHSPWLFGMVNILVHALTSTLLALSILHFCAQLPAREGWISAWLGGLFFCVCALSTEAVSSVVGLSDVLVGCATATILLLVVRLPALTSVRELRKGRLLLTALGVLVASFLGLLGKESMMASLALLPMMVWFRPFVEPLVAKVVAATVTLSLGFFALVLYVFLRNQTFGADDFEFSPLVTSGPSADAVNAFLRWLSPPALPSDPMNNPLIVASPADRILTAGSIFLSQVGLLLFPLHLTADFSFPRQEVTSHATVSSLVGVAAFLGLCVWLALESLRSSRRFVGPTRALFALGGGWLSCSFLPVSNALVALPTVRAERLFYTPTLGGSLCLVACFIALKHVPIVRRAQGAVFLVVLSVVQARAHALHYASDVVFWRATSSGAPASAKSYLNYGVMVGARGDLDERLKYTKASVQAAPDWAMGQIYLGDVYCRRREPERAFPHYFRGLALVARKKDLTALALQCMWERGIFDAHRQEIQDLAAAHPKSWLDYFVRELSQQRKGAEGIPRKYRPRRYNERRGGGGGGG
jgi:hypothetical protein